MTTSVSATKREMKKQFVLERLLAAGVTHSQSGESVYELSYEELKYELVLLAFREIDAECGSQAWF